ALQPGEKVAAVVHKIEQQATTTPANIQEFNTIAGLIFAQLYQSFPVREDIKKDVIANAMNVPPDAFETFKLPSARLEPCCQMRSRLLSCPLAAVLLRSSHTRSLG